MKLLFCLECHDVVKLAEHPRECACQKSGGQYSKDDLTAVYWGKNVFPLGIGNNFLTHIIRASTSIPEKDLELLVSQILTQTAEERGIFAISKKAKSVRHFNRKTVAVKWLQKWDDDLPKGHQS